MKNFTLFRKVGLFTSFSAILLSCNPTDSVDPTTTAPTGKLTETYTNEVAVKWTDLQLKLIKTTAGFAPPVAARSNAYSYLALYEAVVPGISGFQSLKGQLNGLTNIPTATGGQEYNWALAANNALYTVNKSLYATTSAANLATMDSLKTALENTFKGSSLTETVTRSNSFGASVAKAVFDYSKTDGGVNGHLNNFPADYVVPTGVSSWAPTGTQKIPLLPTWGNNRFFSKLNETTEPNPPLAFSYNVTSPFYKEAEEVYKTSKTLTADQTAIAKFWADGGGTFTPPGHYANIATILLKKENANLAKAAETYAKLGMALSDAFTSCWKCKYKYNLLRPQTYIQNAIDPKWKPLLSTPPFPEYTSGHSSGSGAMQGILTKMFGETVSFTDNTNASPRSFTSFTQASDEAMNSRLYGGIHYARGNKEGQANGKKIAENILKLNFKKPVL